MRVCDSARRFTRRCGRAGVLGLASLASCGQGVPSVVSRVDAVRDNLEAQGLAVDTVDCADVPDDEGTVTCRAQVGATQLAMSVGLAPQGGALWVRPLQPTVVVAKIEPEVRTKLIDAGVTVAALSCEGAVWVVEAGRQAHCRATDSDGQAWAYAATFTGEGSNHVARITLMEVP